MSYSSPEEAINDIIENIDFDFEGSVEGAKKVLRATAYLLSARPSSLAQIGASLNFDIGSIRDIHEDAKRFLKARKQKYYKRSLLGDKGLGG